MALKRGVKKKEHENLSSESIERVIKLLEAEKPISKKEACEILNIAYNTARLGKIIEEYKEELRLTAERRRANRGKAFDNYDKQVVIAGVLGGDSVKQLAETLYRSTDSVKRVIAEIGIPERSESYFKPAMLPEQCVREEFESGELVWVSKYNSIGAIREATAHGKSGDGLENVYGVYVFERIEKLAEDERFFGNCRQGDFGGRYAHCRASELGSLEHLKQYGIDLYKTYTPHYPVAIKKAIGMEVK